MLLTNIAVYLAVTSSFTMLLPFAGVFYLCAASRKELLNRDVFVFAAYILVITLAQSLISIYSFAHKVNYILFNLFLPVEIGFFLFLISLFYPIVKNREWIISAIGIVFSYFAVGITSSQNEYPATLVLIESAVVIPLILHGYIRMVKQNRKTEPYQDHIFKGILIYSLANLIIVAFLNKYMAEVLLTFSILNIYANALFLRSFISYGRRKNV